MRRLPGPPARRPVRDRRRRARRRPAPPAGRPAGCLRGRGGQRRPGPGRRRGPARLGRSRATGRLFGTSAPRGRRGGGRLRRGAWPRPAWPPTAKHFPGLGAAHRDHRRGAGADHPPGPPSCARSTWRPSPALIRRDVPLVMLGTAVYPALDPARPRRCRAPIATGELRDRLGFDGVTRHRRARHPGPGARRRARRGRRARRRRGQRPGPVHRPRERRRGGRRPAGRDRAPTPPRARPPRSRWPGSSRCAARLR